MTSKLFVGRIRRRFLAPAAWLLCSFAGVAGATPIPITNASFEDEAGSGFNYSVQDWTDTGRAGTFFSAGSYFTSIPDGTSTAWLHAGTISQTLSATYQASTTYTLRYAVGLASNFSTLPTFGVGFFAGSNTVTSWTANLPNLVTPGNWNERSFEFTVPGSGASYIGQPITIQLRSSGEETNFDNIRLDAVASSSSAPEPATALLLGVGLAGFAGGRRRRRRTTT